MSKKILLATVTLAALLAAPASADIAAGRAALERGDYALALKEIEPLARSDGEAAYKLATMHRNGWGVPTSWSMAAMWYKAAGERGHVQAQFEFAAALEFGRGVVRNRRDAFDWYLRAANQDHAPAMTQVARYHLQGIHRPASFLEGRRWLNRAADAGDVEAQALLDDILRTNSEIIDVPGTAHPVDEAARRVLDEVRDLVGPLLGSDAAARVRLGGEPRVVVAPDGLAVVLPMVEVQAVDGGSIRFGTVRIDFTPDGDDYAVRIALPARAGLVDKHRKVFGNVNIARHEITGRWSSGLRMLTDYRGELADIRITSTRGPATVTIGSIRGGRNFTPLREGRYDIVEELKTRDVAVTWEAGLSRYLARLGAFDYTLQYLDMDVAAMADIALRFGVDWRTGAAVQDVDVADLPTTFPPMLRDMLITVQARDMAVEDAAGKRLGGFTQAELSFGGANLEQALSALTLTYAHDALMAGPDGDLPQEMRVNLSANRLPLIEMASVGMTALRDGVQIGRQRAQVLARRGDLQGAMQASVMTPMAVLTTQGAAGVNAALSAARSELRINEFSMKADGYEIAIAGVFRPSPAGLAGTLDVSVAGAEDLAQALRRGQLHFNGINPMDLLPPRDLAVGEQSEGGRMRELYRIAFQGDGTTTVNGRPLASAARKMARR